MYNNRNQNPHSGNSNNNDSNWNNGNNNNTPFLNGTTQTTSDNHQHHHTNGHHSRPSSSSTAATTLTTSSTSTSPSSTMTTIPSFTLEQQQQKQIEALRRQLAIKEETILDLNASIITIEAETQAKLQQSAAIAAAAARGGGNEQQQQQQLQIQIQQQEQQKQNELLQRQLQEQLQKEAERASEMNRLQQELRRIRQEANISNSRLATLQKKLLLQQQQAAIINNAAVVQPSSSIRLSQYNISPSPPIRAAHHPQQQQQEQLQRVVQSTTAATATAAATTTTCPDAKKGQPTKTPTNATTLGGGKVTTTTNAAHVSTAATATATATTTSSAAAAAAAAAAATLNLLHPSSSGNSSGGGGFCTSNNNISGPSLVQHLLQTVAVVPSVVTRRTITARMMSRRCRNDGSTNNAETSRSSRSSSIIGSSSNIGSLFQSRRPHGCDDEWTTATTTTASTTTAALAQQQNHILVYLGKVVASAAVAAAGATVSAVPTDITNNASERSTLVFLLQECSLSLPLLLPAASTTAHTPPMGHVEEQAAAAAATAAVVTATVENISSNSQKNIVDMEIDDVQENQAPPTATTAAAASTTTWSPRVSTPTTRPTSSTVAMIATTVSRDYISYTWLYHFILATSYNNGASRSALNWLLDQSSQHVQQQHQQQQQQQQQQQLLQHAPPINQVPMEDDCAPRTSNVTHEDNRTSTSSSTKKQPRKRKMAIRIPQFTAVSDAARDTTYSNTASDAERVASELVVHLEQQERLNERLALRAERLVGQRDRTTENSIQRSSANFYPDSEKTAIAPFMQSCRTYALLLPLLLLDNSDSNNRNCRRAVQNKNQYSPASSIIFTASAMVVETSIRALQIVALLHSQQHDFQNQGVWLQALSLLPISSTSWTRPVPVTAQNAGERQEEQKEGPLQQKQNDNDATCLLDLWCHVSHIIFDRSVDKNDSEGRTVTKRRLLRRQEQQHDQPVAPISSTGGNTNATTKNSKQSVNVAAPKSTIGAVKERQQQHSNSISSLVNRMLILSNEMLYDWMAASLHVLRIYWITTLNSSIMSTLPVPTTNTTDSRNLACSQARQQMQHEFWLDSAHPRARNLLSAVLDWMMDILLPTPALHDHPLAMEAIAWLQCLIDQPPMIPPSQDSFELATSTATTSSRNLQHHHQPCFLLLLRTQMSTTASVPRVWHRADTAIGVAVKFFHILVLRQHQDDHLSNKDSRDQSDRLNPIRDALVRFFDSLLRVTQHERRRLEAVSRNKDGDAGGTTKKTKISASFVSFWTLLSEYQELYTSAASLLLTTTTASASAEAENCPRGCHVDADIVAMLRLQMDELAFDEEEREEGLPPP